MWFDWFKFCVVKLWVCFVRFNLMVGFWYVNDKIVMRWI